MKLFKLTNTIKHYEWGSPEWIPALLGKENLRGEPWAELWMGVHGGGPSTIELEGRTVNLREAAGDLPFLFKFLAAARPLSIQAHPNLEQARAGFERENRAGIPVSAPERNYKDPSHKPEILCALTPFTAMAGFREIPGTRELFKRFFAPAAGKTAELGRKLTSALDGGGYGEFLSVLFDKGEREALAGLDALSGAEAGQNSGGLSAKPADGPPFQAEDRRESGPALCAGFIRAFPGDPGVLSPLYLNVLHLKPMEAIYLPAGILHAYVYGLGMECMANSDNVLRGGLTAKHIDTRELFSILRLDPFKPEILNGKETSPSCFRYETPCGEFALFLLKGPRAALKETGDAIAVVIDGQAELSLSGAGSEVQDGEPCVLNRGESAYIPRRKDGEALLFSGKSGPGFTVFAAVNPQ
ncbi:MAG: mannose-6-phosphate isomerase, class I [Treponema sp.]|jgi:mannose-6-phosphate isomerase|nr:mannose-6-phosphate isomerase, class I [Treponema sp.]